MKLVKILSAVMVATTMGATVTVVSPEVTANAKAQKSLKAYPKSLRRTWYHYEKNDKGQLRYSTLKFTATRTTDKWNGYMATKTETSKFVLHQYNPAKKFNKGKLNWNVAYKSGSSTLFGLWGDSKADMVRSQAIDRYKVVTTTYKGKKIKVLHATFLPSAPLNTMYYYTSKKLAKQTNPKGYNYGNNYGY